MGSDMHFMIAKYFPDFIFIGSPMEIRNYVFNAMVRKTISGRFPKPERSEGV